MKVVIMLEEREARLQKMTLLECMVSSMTLSGLQFGALMFCSLWKGPLVAVPCKAGASPWKRPVLGTCQHKNSQCHMKLRACLLLDQPPTVASHC